MHAPVAVQFHGTMPFGERHRERVSSTHACVVVQIELARTKNQWQYRYISVDPNGNHLLVNQEINFDGV
jgi:hypothetical protein